MKNTHLKAAIYIAPTPDFGSPEKNRRKGVANGYIIIPDGHPWFGLHYDDVPLSDYIHGGLTHSHGQRRTFRCLNGDVQSIDYWVIGFDTCHSGDNSLEQDLDYVWREAHRLAAMADEAADDEVAVKIPTAPSHSEP